MLYSRVDAGYATDRKALEEMGVLGNGKHGCSVPDVSNSIDGFRWVSDSSLVRLNLWDLLVYFLLIYRTRRPFWSSRKGESRGERPA